MTATVNHEIDRLYRSDARAIFATLLRLLGSFDLAEEALHEAFAAALAQWPRDGMPDNPRAWLISAGRFRLIDRLRRRARFEARLDALARELEMRRDEEADRVDEAIEDDRLRLIFTCCHPALPADARVALTLRELCGLTTEEIARAYLSRPSTLAQRIVRAKAKIRDKGIPYEVPAAGELAQRLDTVLRVVYLIFNEGYSATSGERLHRLDLAAEAIRLGRLLVALLPEPESVGLLALMLLHDARSAARATPEGDLVLLEDQDRSLWNRSQIAEGLGWLERALGAAPAGPFCLQAALAAEHARAATAADTDWGRIARIYDRLLALQPSPVVELNRAVAVAMRDGAEAGLALIDDLDARGELNDYHLLHAARADLCRRLGRREDARAAYRRALELTGQAPERRFLQRRLDAL